MEMLHSMHLFICRLSVLTEAGKVWFLKTDKKEVFILRYCKKCGMKIVGGIQPCPACGSAAGTVPERPAGKGQAGCGAKLQELFQTTDATGQFDSADIAENRMAAALAYVGLLVLVPLYAAKGSAFARYHARQGIVLIIVSAAYSIANGMLAAAVLAVSWRLYFILRITRLMGLAFPVLAVTGIVNAVNGKAKELLVIGKIRLFR